jgi:DNA-binding XRE family transcriptional regulator
MTRPIAKARAATLRAKAVRIVKDARGRPEFALLRWRDYRALVAAAEDEDDRRFAATAAARLARDRGRAARERVEATAPEAVVKAEIGGASALRAWREHCGLTQDQLAKAAGISKPYLAQLEAGDRHGQPRTWRRLAKALGVLVDLILP